jgi:hypothetical protein
MGGQIATVEDFAREEGVHPRDVIDFVLDNERARLVATKSALKQCETMPPEERLPLVDEHGNEFGRVAASIPENMFYHLMKRRDLDPTWIQTADGVHEVMKEVLHDNPACRVKTVSGKTMVGWMPTKSRSWGSIFGKANFNGLKPTT